MTREVKHTRKSALVLTRFCSFSTFRKLKLVIVPLIYCVYGFKNWLWLFFFFLVWLFVSPYSTHDFIGGSA